MEVLYSILDSGDRAPTEEQIYSVSLRLTRLKDLKLGEAVDFSSREVLKHYLL